MATAVLLPVAAFVIGFVAVLFFERPKHAGYARAPAPAASADSGARVAGPRGTS